MRFKNLFNKMKFLQSGVGCAAKAVIDIETLEVFPSMVKAAEKYGLSVPALCSAITLGTKFAGRRFEYLQDWQYWTDREKEKFTRKNNIYFLKGNKL